MGLIVWASCSCCSLIAPSSAALVFPSAAPQSSEGGIPVQLYVYRLFSCTLFVLVLVTFLLFYSATVYLDTEIMSDQL